MNYAALLGVLAAVTFTLPLIASLAEMLGLHRSAGVATSLGIAALAAVIWYLKASGRGMSRAASRRGSRPDGRVNGAARAAEEDDAGLQGHR